MRGQDDTHKEPTMPEPSKELEAAARAAAAVVWKEWHSDLDDHLRAGWIERNWNSYVTPLRAAIAAVLREPSPELVAAIASAIRAAKVQDNLSVGETIEVAYWQDDDDIQAMCVAAAEDALRAAAHHVLGEGT